MAEVLDLSVLDSMFGDDLPLRAAILQEFVKYAEPYLCELDAAMDSRKRQGVRYLAHKLKSSARTVGAGSLADACDTLERIATDSEWEQIAGLAEAIRRELRRTLAAIANL